jgi:acyl-CoA reductase-like NAD-dependent aldehyde dehydrogenase
MGALISRQHMNRVHGVVQRAEKDGYNVVCGGQPLAGKEAKSGYDFSKGAFYPPTVLTLPEKSSGNDTFPKVSNSEIWREEVFGPVVLVVPFKDEEQAIARANDSQHGLGASLWTDNLSRAHRVSKSLASGVVWVNAHHRNDPSSIWGGVVAANATSSASGLGRENGLEALHAYTQSKSVCFNVASLETRRKQEDWFAEPQEGEQKVRYG